jgi:hypothetical protein
VLGGLIEKPTQRCCVGPENRTSRTDRRLKPVDGSDRLLVAFKPRRFALERAPDGLKLIEQFKGGHTLGQAKAPIRLRAQICRLRPLQPQPSHSYPHSHINKIQSIARFQPVISSRGPYVAKQYPDCEGQNDGSFKIN